LGETDGEGGLKRFNYFFEKKRLESARLAPTIVLTRSCCFDTKLHEVEEKTAKHGDGKSFGAGTAAAGRGVACTAERRHIPRPSASDGDAPSGMCEGKGWTPERNRGRLLFLE